MAYGRRRAAAGAVLAAAVLLSGCSSEDGASSHGAAAVAQAPQAAGGQPATVNPSAAAGAGKGATAPVETRQISYTAQLSVRVADVPKAVTSAEALAVPGTGGYVAEEQVQSAEGGGQASARLVLKLPTAGFPQALDQLAGLGQVLDRRSQAQDLTQQLVDLDSRVKSQQASVERIRELMKNATGLADVVSLEAELSRREADLESLQRQRQDLGGQVALSTVTLQLTTAAPAPAVPAKAKEKGFWAAVGGAFAGGGHVLLTVLRGIVVVLAAAAPFLLVAAGLATLFWTVRRRLPAKRHTERTDDAQG
ncbi:DUF4349 domain-containing protein [Kitasatospora sp. NPDC002227]|uniref:DUF4349 domain-containing protein n=1 Tax=Kitasatospora sp. NPDC002227 TaxID=3154773 RepID=UPI00332DD3F5